MKDSNQNVEILIRQKIEDFLVEIPELLLQNSHFKNFIADIQDNDLSEIKYFYDSFFKNENNDELSKILTNDYIIGKGLILSSIYGYEELVEFFAGICNVNLYKEQALFELANLNSLDHHLCTNIIAPEYDVSLLRALTLALSSGNEKYLEITLHGATHIHSDIAFKAALSDRASNEMFEFILSKTKLYPEDLNYIPNLILISKNDVADKSDKMNAFFKKFLIDVYPSNNIKEQISNIFIEILSSNEPKLFENLFKELKEYISDKFISSEIIKDKFSLSNEDSVAEIETKVLLLFNKVEELSQKNNHRLKLKP